ncbi:MAG: prepilin peptidase [Patescibacteria group bacterium]|nr:prepilin peptidase [Patescibacteria group bacterium]
MILIYIFIFIFGLCIGSFINALVYRLYEEMPIAKARSICPKCKHQLRWQDNIPLISFIFLRGQCHFCREKISWQYPLIELATGALFVLASYFVFLSSSSSYYFIILLLYYFITLSFLITIFLFDLKHSLIPDKISLPAIVVVLIFQIFFWLGGEMPMGLGLKNLSFVAISAIIGGSWFALQYFLSKGKWVGGGDIRLGILMGIVLPWPHILTALFLSYIVGALVALPLLIFKKKTMKSEIPFGVFLVPTTLIVMFWGEKIVNWYLNIF